MTLDKAAHRLLEIRRAELCNVPLPELKAAAGALYAVLNEAFPNLTDDQRQILAGAIAVIEQHGGGNEADDTVAEKLRALEICAQAAIDRAARTGP